MKSALILKLPIIQGDDVAIFDAHSLQLLEKAHNLNYFVMLTVFLTFLLEIFFVRHL